MPLRRRKSKPVGEPLGFAASRGVITTSFRQRRRSDCLKSTMIISGTGSDGRAKSIYVQPVRFGNRYPCLPGSIPEYLRATFSECTVPKQPDARLSLRRRSKARGISHSWWAVTMYGGQNNPFHRPEQLSNPPLHSAMLNRFSLAILSMRLRLSRSRCRQEEKNLRVREAAICRVVVKQYHTGCVVGAP